MKVGIVTWYGVTNYGSALQAYALQGLVQEAGAECSILRHRVHERSEVEARSAVRPRFHPRNMRQLSPGRRAARKGEAGKTDAMAAFRAKYLNVSREYLEDCEVDHALIGSDQVLDARTYHGFQFGHSVNAEKISTFSPSFGEMTWDTFQASPHRDDMVTGIKRMHRLSARDYNTRHILSRVAERDVPITLDPTLVYDFAREKNAWLTPPPAKKYVLIYTWGGTSTTREFAEATMKFAQRHGLTTVSVGDTRSWCDINMHSASPTEYFSLVSQASAVVTNMFHGTCFSLSLGTPVIPIVMPHNENKLGGLLKLLGLDGQRLDEVADVAQADIPTLYDETFERRLAGARHVSRSYLLDTLAEAENGSLESKDQPL